MLWRRGHAENYLEATEGNDPGCDTSYDRSLAQPIQYRLPESLVE